MDRRIEHYKSDGKRLIFCFFTASFLIATFSVFLFSQNSDLRILEKPKSDSPNGHGTISAARKIKFVPATKDGNPINTSKLVSYSYSWNGWSIPDNKAEDVIKNAIRWLGGVQYLKITTQIGRGKFSVMKDNVTVSFQSFHDVIAFPDKERTEFKGQGARIIQVNVGGGGWMYNADEEAISEQTERQIENFERSKRTSLENLLRGDWRGRAELSYVGRRPSTLGKRNDVVKLTYDDGFKVEFEFAADDATPHKAITRKLNADGGEIVEEDRFARFIEIGGVKTPSIIDRFANGVQISRVSYDSIEFNKPVPDSIFSKPDNPKAAKKSMRL